MSNDIFVVGDEVIFKTSSTKFVITSIGMDGGLNGIGKDGIAFCDKNPDNWSKTGRHFKEAEDLMLKLQEETTNEQERT